MVVRPIDEPLGFLGDVEVLLAGVEDGGAWLDVVDVAVPEDTTEVDAGGDETDDPPLVADGMSDETPGEDPEEADGCEGLPEGEDDPIGGGLTKDVGEDAVGFEELRIPVAVLPVGIPMLDEGLLGADDGPGKDTVNRLLCAPDGWLESAVDGALNDSEMTNEDGYEKLPVLKVVDILVIVMVCPPDATLVMVKIVEMVDTEGLDGKAEGPRSELVIDAEEGRPRTLELPGMTGEPDSEVWLPLEGTTGVGGLGPTIEL